MEVQLITSLQQRRPLVLAVTNFITAGAVANCLSAAGMSPLMPSDPAEAAELVALADAVVVNIGSVGAEQAALLRAVVTAARQLKKPLVLDPVAVGASQARRQLITELLAGPVTLIRGNASEIAVLAEATSHGHGIDAGAEPNLAQVAAACAKRHACLVVLSGPVDYVSDGQHTKALLGGSPLMPKVVGTGDMLSAFLAGCLTLPMAPLTAAELGTAYFGQAGAQADDGQLGHWLSNFLTVLAQAPHDFGKAVQTND